MSDKPIVLFVCVHNAGRSQMAQGWLRHLAGDRVEVCSAGSIPGDAINPVAVEAMAEVGIDIRNEAPKILTVDTVQASAVVITMGLRRHLPDLPRQALRGLGTHRPAGQVMDTVHHVRDEIRTRIQALLEDLLADHPAQAEPALPKNRRFTWTNRCRPNQSFAGPKPTDRSRNLGLGTANLTV